MATIVTKTQTSSLAMDGSGKLVESVSIKNWRPKRVNVTAAAWVDLSDGFPRSSIYIKNNGASNVILAPASTGYSNDPTQATAGLTILPGGAIEPTFADKLQIYARTEVGGGTCQLTVVEAF
jgi:hypothetical protein